MTLTPDNIQALRDVIDRAREEKAMSIQVQIDLFAALVDAAKDRIFLKKEVNKLENKIGAIEGAIHEAIQHG